VRARAALLVEIREQGYAGSMNLFYRYIARGRVKADRPHLSPARHPAPAHSAGGPQRHLAPDTLSKLAAACPRWPVSLPSPVPLVRVPESVYIANRTDGQLP
jgi:hypothetical protein